jgi:hypothetical protein
VKVNEVENFKSKHPVREDGGDFRGTGATLRGKISCARPRKKRCAGQDSATSEMPRRKLNGAVITDVLRQERKVFIFRRFFFKRIHN